MKRAFDLLLALLLLPFAMIVGLFVVIAIKLTSKGPLFYLSERVGRGKKIFRMAKFRTMRVDTPQVATHQMTEPEKYLTPVGGALRRLSLDEIPQLWNIIKGEMSFVGPRPALFNQDDLVALRDTCGINGLVPGLTGWAQVNGRDELSIPEKVDMDRHYLERRSLWFDLYIIWLTAKNAVTSEGVRH